MRKLQLEGLCTCHHDELLPVQKTKSIFLVSPMFDDASPLQVHSGYVIILETFQAAVMVNRSIWPSGVAWNAISLPICFPKTTESLMTQIWIKKIVHCLSLWGTLGNITKPLLAKLLCTTADSIKTGKQWLSYHTAKQQIEQFLMTRCIVSVCICVHAHGTCVGVRVYLHPRDKGL